MCQESLGKDLLCLKFYKVECTVHYVWVFFSVDASMPIIHCFSSSTQSNGTQLYCVSLSNEQIFSHTLMCICFFLPKYSYSCQTRSFLFCRIFVHTPKVCILSGFIFPLIFARGHHMCLTVLRESNQFTLEPLMS